MPGANLTLNRPVAPSHRRHRGERQAVARLALAMLAFLVFAAAHISAATFTATLDRNMVAVGDTATLRLTFQGGTPAAIPTPPQVPGLSIRYAGQESTYNNVNGRSTSIFTFAYQVSAPRVGDYTIPAITLQVDNEQLASQPLKLSVVKTGNAAAQVAFLTLDLPQTNFYVGETTAAATRLYYRGGQPQREPALSGDGALLGTNVVMRRLPQVQTNNAIYHVAEWLAPVTFIKAGQFEISAADCLLSVTFQRPGSFFGEERQFNLAADPLAVHVLPLPTTNVPAGFKGTVGEFTLAATLSTNAVTAGDPLTLSVRISGTGALDQVTWTVPDSWKNWKSYPPTSRVEPTTPLGTIGAKVFEQVLVPESPDIHQIPGFDFSFFDPVRARYTTLRQPPIPVRVRPGLAATAQPIVTAPAAAGTPPQPNADIVHIKNRPGTLATAGTPLLFRPWFIALQLVPVALWLGARTWRRRQQHLGANPRLRRRYKVERLVRSGLTQLRSEAAAGQADAFQATLVRLLQEQIGERLDLPASAITGEAVDRLRSLGLDPQSASRLDSLFQAVDQARYAPQRSSADLLATVSQVEEVLRQVAALEPTPPSGATTHAVRATVATLFFAAALLNSSQAADSPTDLFDRANRAYEQGQFAAAITNYTAVLQLGYESPAVRFNLGNAEFKAGHLGRAIAHYRAALLLAPRDPDILANLQHARQALGVTAPLQPAWQRAVTLLSLDEWTLTASAAFIAWMLTLALGQWRPSLQPPLKPLILGTLLVLLAGVAGSAATWRITRSERTAIVVTPDSAVRYGPVEVSEVHFTAHDGMELRYLDSETAWVQVSDRAGRIGWVPRKDVLVFPP